MQQILIL